jgi:multidrug efflux pump subunit AcrB
MDNIIVDLNILSLLNKVVNVQEITIDGARVTAEQKGSTTNIQELLKSLDNEAATESPATMPISEETEDDPTAGIDILIKVGQFNFINSATQLVTEKWGDKNVSIPAIKLSNIGDESGVPPEALANAIVKPLLKQLNKALKGRMQDLLREEAKAKLKEKEDELKAKMDKKLQEKLGDDAEGVGNAIKSLFSK